VDRSSRFPSLTFAPRARNRDIEPWVCWSRANPLVQKVQTSDGTDSDWICIKAQNLELSVRTAYYLIKALGALAKVAPPP
jgi:hypothetical protein